MNWEIISCIISLIVSALILNITYLRGYNSGREKGFRDGREYNERILPK